MRILVFTAFIATTLVFCSVVNAKENEESSNQNRSSVTLDFFLFDVEDDQVRISELRDLRNFKWYSSNCDFTVPKNCRYGSLEYKWSFVNGTNRPAGLGDSPDYPVIGVWSDKSNTATLYSDPVHCLETAKVTVKLWTKGTWSFQICFISPYDGKILGCGTSLSSASFKIHKLTIDEPLLDFDYHQESGMILVLFGVVDNGVILIDEIKIVGIPCDEVPSDSPMEHIDFKRFGDAEPFIKNELMHPVFLGHFKSYLKYIMKAHEDILGKLKEGHVCAIVDCLEESETCNYNGDLGTIPFTFEKRHVTSKQVNAIMTAKFKHDSLDYAILTSPKFKTNGRPPRNTQLIFSSRIDNLTLTFNYNKAAFKRKLLVCFYFENQRRESNCKLVNKDPEHAENNWNRIALETPRDTNMFQIIVQQQNLFESDDEDMEAIIQDIDIENCRNFDDD